MLANNLIKPNNNYNLNKTKSIRKNLKLKTTDNNILVLSLMRMRKCCEGIAYNHEHLKVKLII